MSDDKDEGPEHVERPADVKKISAELSACSTLDELTACADRHRARVRELHADPVLKVFAIQILNLKSYKAGMIENDRS